MITTLLLSILGLVLAIGFIMAFSTCTVIGEFSFLKTSRSGKIQFHWIHPRIANVSYDFGERTVIVKIAGWTRAKRAREPGESESGAPRGSSGSGPEITPPSALSHNDAGGGVPGGTFRDDGREPDASEPPEPAASGPRGAGIAAAEAQHSEPRKKEAAAKGLFWRKLRRSVAIVRKRRWYSKVLRWVLRTIRLCFRVIRFDRLRFHIAAGLDDPAETGKLYGWYNAVSKGLVGRQNNVEVRFEPRFFDAAVECEGTVAFTSSIARVLTPVFVALLTFPYLSSFVVWRGLRKVYKQPAHPQRHHDQKESQCR